MPLKLSLLVLPFITDPCRTFTIFDFNFDMMTSIPYILGKPLAHPICLLLTLLHSKFSKLKIKTVNFFPMIIILTSGELALTATVVALHCYWFWYWAFGWGYRPITVMEFDIQDGLET